MAAILGMLVVLAGTAQADSAAYPEGTSLVPLDGKWLKDSDGRQYFIDRISKSYARRVGAGDVRTGWGIKIDVIREDAEYFYYKIYRAPDDSEIPVNAWENENVDPAQAEAVAALYRIELNKVDRIRLEPFGDGLPGSGQWRDGFDIADMNGDGQADIVHGPARKSLGPPVIFLGDGQGHWRAWRDVQWPPLGYDYGDVAVGDLNGDALPDLTFAVHLKGLLALTGDGKGGFADAGKGLPFASQAGDAASTPFSSRALSTLDWDGDGRMDILAFGEGPRLASNGTAGSYSNGVVLYLNRGGDGWARRDQGIGKGQNFGRTLATGDFNGDKRTDFATGTNVQGRRDLINIARSDGSWKPIELEELRNGAIVRSVAAADFNGDGVDDLAMAYLNFEAGQWRSGADVMLSTAGGQIWRRQPLMAGEDKENAAAVAAGDLDGDGAMDVAALTARGELSLFLGDGTGGFAEEIEEVPPFGNGCTGSFLMLRDMNQDGRAEIVASFSYESDDLPLEYAAEEAAAPQPQRCPSEGGITAWKSMPRN